MQTSKPKPLPIPTVYVNAMDKRTGKSRGMAVYNTTPEELIEKLRKLLGGEPKPPRRRASDPVAA